MGEDRTEELSLSRNVAGSGGRHPADETTLRAKLRRVYWIGGGSCAGKTTIAHRIASEQSLTAYSTDDAMSDHAKRTTSAESPYLSRFKAMDMDERWLTRTPETMLDTFHWFQGEGFNLVIEDLLRAPSEKGLVVEGFRLLPHLVKPLLTESNHALWLLPTPEFRAAVMEAGKVGWEFLGGTSDPHRALENLFERDRLFTDRLRVEAKHLGLQIIEVHPGTNEDDLTAQVLHMFKL